MERSGAHLLHGELEAGEHAVEVELLDGQLARAEDVDKLDIVKQVEDTRREEERGMEWSGVEGNNA